MAIFRCFNPSALATITVTFNPDLELLRAQLKALPDESQKFFVDNASNRDILLATQSLIKQTPNACLISVQKNHGLAQAINIGAHVARKTAPGAQFLLFLDQDSEPMPGSIELLIEAFFSIKESGAKVGCVGPNLVDVHTGLFHGFHQRTRWRWKRVYRDQTGTEPVLCANLNGSGTLVASDIFFKLGGLESSFFIDHVDTEWAFRLQAYGYRLFGVPGSIFRHYMGDRCSRIWFFGWHVWPVRLPSRHYYLFRNAVTLLSRTYVPTTWKVYAVLKLALTALIVLGLGPSRGQQISGMLRGLHDGFRLRSSGSRKPLPVEDRH